MTAALVCLWWAQGQRLPWWMFVGLAVDTFIAIPKAVELLS